MNKESYLPSFPYLGTPHSGYNAHTKAAPLRLRIPADGDERARHPHGHDDGHMHQHITLHVLKDVRGRAKPDLSSSTSAPARGPPSSSPQRT